MGAGLRHGQEVRPDRPRQCSSVAARLLPSTGIQSVAEAQFTTNDTAEGLGTVFAPLETTDFTSYINQVVDSGANVVIVTWAGAGFIPLFQQMPN